MPRIAKADVNKALTVAAKTIIEAGGTDGRTSRAEMKARLSELPKEQRALADIFFRFIDHRDFKKGAQVTATDVNRAVTYAKTHLIAKYDLNQNGLSRDEISKMSLTGKRAVDLAKVLKASAADGGGALSSTKLGQEVGKLAKDAIYMSEGDSNPEFFARPFPAGHDLTGHNVMTALNGVLSSHFDQQDGDLSSYTFEKFSAREAKAFIKDLATPPDDGDALATKSAKAFEGINALLTKNLTDLQVFKVGPKDARTGSLSVDQGAYAYVIIGRTSDGKVAGVNIGSVET
ncbi:MAG: nuclease A inhibitor family protein [Myxococcaceae bacterium]|nr:nuclease A inhibitor family protein [Myxococcaceae bacterium]